MIYWLLMHVLSFSLDLPSTIGVAISDKDLETSLLRQQVRILQRKVNAQP
jgi:hypothetical protein